MVIKVGDTVPPGVFSYVPWTPELEDGAVCGIATKLKTDEWKGKKVIVISVPGAFTPTCHVNHIPPFVEKYDQLKAKSADVVAVVAANDAFVMSAWGRVLGAKDKILMLSDTYVKWTTELGLAVDMTVHGMGIRTGRWAMILDDLKVTYVEAEKSPGEVISSSAETVLAKL